MELGNIKVKIGASISDFQSKMSQVSKRLSGLGTVSKGVGVAGAKAIGLITASLGILETAIGITGVKYDAMLEQSQIAWSTILGSQKEAATTLKTLQKMGAETPFEFEGLDKSAKLLEMAGFKGKDLFTTLQKVGDAVSAVGGNDEVLQGVSMAMFQMATKGKISAEEMNQLAERGIPAWQLVADQMHVPVKELMAMSQKGNLYAKNVLPLLIKGMGQAFGGSMQKQSQTFNGMLSTIKDNTKQLAGILAKPLFDKLKKGLQATIPIIDAFTQLAKGNFKGFEDTLLKAVGPDATLKISAFVVGIRTGFQFISNVFKKVMDVAKQVFPIVVKYVGQFANAYKTYVSGLFSGKNNLGQSFVSMFNTIKSIALPILQDVLAFIKTTLSGITKFWHQNGAQITQAVKNMWAVIAAIFKFFAPVISFIIKSVWGSIKGIISGAISVIEGIIKVFTGIFTGDWHMLWSGIKSILLGAVKLIWNIFSLMMYGKLIGGIKALAKGAVSLFRALGTDAVDIFKGLWQRLIGIVKSIAKGIANYFRGLGNDIRSIFGAMRDYGASIFRSLWRTIEGIASNIVSSVKGAFSRMWNGVKSIASSLKNGVISAFKGIWNSATSIFNRVKSAITHPITTAKNTVLGIIRTIKHAFAFLKIRIPTPHIPHISFDVGHKKIGPISVPYPILHWNASGGIMTKPTMFAPGQGGGEAGPEAIMPLQGHYMKPFADAVAKNLNGNTGGTVINNFTVHATIREDADVDKLAQKLNDLQIRATRRTGGR